ncbi:MAG: hypothetical protein HC905_04170 [Bacteroidales bacterium]|nr:hypothetical protein [Bacteroidales bacterium]
MIRIIEKAFVFLSVFYVMTSFAYSQNRSFKFEKINTEHGLSQATVNCIFQDSRGYLWIGTNDGLNRYDGYNFKIFRNSDTDSLSISGNLITCIAEDTCGMIWVGTRDNGLNVFERKTGKFKRYLNKKRRFKITEPQLSPFHLCGSW